MTTPGKEVIVIEVNKAVQWILGLCAFLITGLFGWGTKEIVTISKKFDVIDNRVTVIEQGLYSANRDHITQREYDAAMTAIQTSLARIEAKIDKSHNE